MGRVKYLYSHSTRSADGRMLGRDMTDSNQPSGNPVSALIRLSVKVIGRFFNSTIVCRYRSDLGMCFLSGIRAKLDHKFNGVNMNFFLLTILGEIAKFLCMGQILMPATVPLYYGIFSIANR